MIARTKIILNVLQDETIACDAFHLTYLLSLKSFVVTETSAHDLAAGRVTCGYPQLVATVTQYLNDEAARQHIANQGYESIKTRPQTVPLRSAITGDTTVLFILIRKVWIHV